MTKKKDIKREIKRMHQICENDNSKPIDYYIRLYTQIVREISEHLKNNKILMKPLLSNEDGVNQFSNGKRFPKDLKNY